jgi:hypothetical protein
MTRLHVGLRVGWPSIRQPFGSTGFAQPHFRKEDARRSFAELTRASPELTIRQLRSALPHTRYFRDRACEGLASLGMQW